MRRTLALVLIGLAGCGWQPTGNSVPNSTASSLVSVQVGHTITVTLPTLSAGSARSADSSAPAIATVTIDAAGSLVISGVASGSATVTERDTNGATTVRQQTFVVTVTP